MAPRGPKGKPAVSGAPQANLATPAYAFRTSHMIGTGAFTTPDRLVRVAW
jgi:hypothetical protein